MVSVFTQPDVNTREVGRTRDKRIELIECIPTSQVFTSGYVNTETILHFFYEITNERGTKTVFTYAHVKWFYGQSERAYYLNYFIERVYSADSNSPPHPRRVLILHPAGMDDSDCLGLPNPIAAI